MLKTADVEIALEHYEQQKRRRKKQQPCKAFEIRFKIGEVVKIFKEPYYVADKSCDGARNKRCFILALSAVRTHRGKKNKIEHPTDSDHCADSAGNFYLFYEHKDKCKHKIPPKKSITLL